MSRKCNICFQEGHDKRTCPQHTMDIEKWYSDMKGQRNAFFEAYGEDHEYYKNRLSQLREILIGRTGVDPDTGAVVDKQFRKDLKKRKTTCSYCKTPGHTRRTCTHLKEDMAVCRYLISQSRRHAYKHMKQMSINVGTLVVVKSEEWAKGENGVYGWQTFVRPYLVAAFDWDRVDYGENTDRMAFIRIESLVPFPGDTCSKIKYLSVNMLRHSVVDISPSSTSVTPPPYWLKGEDHPQTPRTLQNINFPTGMPRDSYYSRSAFKNVEHPAYQARLTLGLSLVTNF